jgi:cytochrome oxidase Cu insertion factor (SCO1/SenC/PrrC family)/thiol-disulfide isomerase/thioredoxin
MVGAAAWRGRRAVAALLVAGALTAALWAALPQSARADGDPGSDVLVYQSLFLTTQAGVPVSEQVRLGALLEAAGHARFPVRVAIVAAPSDLGAVTSLWRKPRAYARFLGLELSLAYRGRLLVVMPNGFGFSWPGHSTAAAYHALAHIRVGSTGAGLARAAEAAVSSLAAGARVRLPSGASLTSRPSPPHSAAPRSSNGGGQRTLAFVALGLFVAAAVAARIALPRLLRRRRAPGRRDVLARGRAAGARAAARCLPRPGTGVWVLSVAAVGLLAALGVAAHSLFSGPSAPQDAPLATNPSLDPGTTLAKPAPDFTLSDQFGQRVSLKSFRGKVVVLAFNDAQCTTVCPLTTSAMLDAKAMLGRVGDRVQLLGVDANPKATAVADVLAYSQVHGMVGAWRFLTGSLPALKRVWRAYSIGVQITQSQVDHSPALFVIGPDGRLAKLYVTQPSYAAVPQLAQLLAREASRLLPEHPTVHSNLSYRQIPGISPTQRVTLPLAAGGTVPVGPRPGGRLFLFFATWDQEVTSLAAHLSALNSYVQTARRNGLPTLTAVDEGSVEPPGALPRFLQRLPDALRYPVAIDRSGRLADGYEVQGQPWFVLVSPQGRVVWYWQVANSGWLGQAELVRQVRAALARSPKSANGAVPVQQQLAGSPPPLAALHRQAGRLVGQGSALMQRIRSLRGYSIVVNAWASWCTPCREEFTLFADAAARYGKKVAFLGADTDDSSGDARAFLTQHPVSYPSYTEDNASLGPLAVIEGLPTTVFIGPDGKVVWVHNGEYQAQGSLDSDIATYALGAK